MNQKNKTLIKFKNDFNSLPLTKFTANELNLFFAIVSKIMDKGTEKVEITFLELKKTINLAKNYTNNEFADQIISVNNKLLMLNYELATIANYNMPFALFNTYTTNKYNKTLTVSINPEYEYFLNDLANTFTIFELEEFINIKSIYAKECYRRLKQYKSTGFWIVSYEEFKKILNVPESYRACHVNDKVLKPVQKELSLYFGNLNIVKVKSEDAGNPITHLEFYFDVEK